jgi:hypothetical protein
MIDFLLIYIPSGKSTELHFVINHSLPIGMVIPRQGMYINRKNCDYEATIPR